MNIQNIVCCFLSGASKRNVFGKMEFAFGVFGTVACTC